MNPNDPLPNPQQPPNPVVPTTQPQPVQPPVVPPTQPVQPFQPDQPAPVAGLPPKSGKTKKLIIIAVAVVGGLIAIGIIAFFALRLLGGGVPKYTTAKSVELAGFKTTDQNSGMKFDVPEQMKEKIKTDLSAEYYDFADEENESKGWRGFVFADIQSIPLKTLDDDSLKALADAFLDTDDFDKGFIEEVNGEDIKNVKVSNKEATDSNKQLQADLSMEVKGSDDSFVPARGRLILYIRESKIYVYAFVFTNQVYDANQDFINKLPESVEVGV